MKCLNCGCENPRYLCVACATEQILDKVFYEIRTYRPETCENVYLAEFAAGLTEKYAERDIIPEILGYFDFEISEYYYCQYFKMRRDNRFEAAALNYLEKHARNEEHSQRVMYDLIESYIPSDFIKPKKWCEWIACNENLYGELYAVAAKYFAMIGEYDMADEIADKGLALCKDAENRKFIFCSLEGMVGKLEKQKEDTLRYRTKKPYWPATEERRRAVAMFYDAKGIAYPRIKSKPQKVKESEFTPIMECYEDELTDYCAFWCAEAFSITAVKSMYQLAAVKVRDGKVMDTWESYIRPWDGGERARTVAAKEVGVSVEVIESAEDVDMVLPKFFAFVEEDVLVSTGALGNQAKLISRAARYAGMKEIKNEFYDLLDLAADVSAEFDLANNTREFLLSNFSIEEGKTALEKAHNNKRLYDLLIHYEE